MLDWNQVDILIFLILRDGGPSFILGWAYYMLRNEFDWRKTLLVLAQAVGLYFYFMKTFPVAELEKQVKNSSSLLFNISVLGCRAVAAFFGWSRMRVAHG